MQQNYQEQMKTLEEAKGKQIIIAYVEFRKKRVEKITLREVKPFENVQTEQREPFDIAIPFIGYLTAIQRILDENGRTIYQNPDIYDWYNIREPEKLFKLIRQCFGSEISKYLRQEAALVKFALR